MVERMEKPYKPEQINHILNPIVKKWFFSRFKDYSLPQLYGVMEIHSRNNILISAPTGATKTLTGFLSILNELIDSSEKGILEDKIYCVYISPLRALSEDIKHNLVEPLKEMEEMAGKKFGIRVASRTGDTDTYEKAKMLKNPPHILITTPESLAIVLSSFKFVDHLKDVQWCIIDEIHALAENKRGTHLSLSMERLQKLSPAITRVGLSAIKGSLERLGIDKIELYMLHAADNKINFMDSLKAFKELQDTGIVKNIGDLQQLKEAQTLIEVVSVENHFSLNFKGDEAELLPYLTDQKITFLPYFPFSSGNLLKDKNLIKISDEINLKPSQVALSWITSKWPTAIPIPGTANKEHLLENLKAADINLEKEIIEKLDGLF